MAAWGAKPAAGAWSNQVDEEEAENGGELAPVPVAAVPEFPALGGSKSAFPSLGETAGLKDTKRERKSRGQKMSLGAFVAAGKKEKEVVNLPTGPRARSDEDGEKRDGLGGGFKNYGGDRGGGFGDRDRDRDDERSFRRAEDEGPSRADAADDWGTKKAFVPSGPSRGGFGDRDRGGGFGDRYTERRSGFGDGETNRADDANRWESKGFEPSARRGGFEDRDRQSSFGSKDFGGPSRAETEDRWSRGAPTSADSESRFGGTSSAASSGSRPRLNLKPRSTELPVLAPPPPAASSEAGSEDLAKDDPAKQLFPMPKTGPRPNPFGSAKPVDVKVPVELVRSESKTSQSTSEADVPQAAPKPRVNPFGSARPREEVLKEKGVDLEALDTGRRTPRTSEAGKSDGGDSPTPGKSDEAADLSLPVQDAGSAEADSLVAESTSAQDGSSKEADLEAAGLKELTKELENGATVTLAAEPSKPAAGTWAKIAAKSAEPAAEVAE